MSPSVPNGTHNKPALDRSIHHEPVEGRKTAGSALLSPSKSPGVVMSEDSPHWLAEKPAVERSTYQLPSDGRKTETSVRPSPSKSALDFTDTLVSQVWLPFTRTLSMYHPGFGPTPVVLVSAAKRNRNWTFCPAAPAGSRAIVVR